jgi:hypothetical protein
VLLAFGTVLATDDTDDAAVRTALALREAVGEAAPGYGLGVALAGLVLPVHRAGGVRVPPASPPACTRSPAPPSTPPSWSAATCPRASPHLAHGTCPIDHVQPRLPDAPPGQPRRLPPAPTAPASPDGSRLASPDGSPTPRLADGPGPHRSPDVRGAALRLGRRRRRAWSAVVLVGRDLEMKAVRDAFAEAIRGRSARVVQIVGDAGIGKRALVDRFVASLPRSACVVLRGSGQWRRRNSSLGVFLEIVRDFLDIDASTTAADLTNSA